MPTQQHQQDSSKEAKYSKKRGGDQLEDREVVIYDNADKIREHMRDVQTQGGGRSGEERLWGSSTDPSGQVWFDARDDSRESWETPLKTCCCVSLSV